MSEIVVRSVLLGDTVDRTPADVMAANPGITWIGGASAVPPYLYQSMSTLWFGTSGMASAWPNVVMYGLGTGENSPKGAVEVYTNRAMNQSYDYTSFRTDMPGSEVSNIYINVILPKNTATLSTYAKVQNLTFRIRYLLDNDTRGNRTRIGAPVPGSLPVNNVLADPSIDWNYPYLMFFRDLSISTMASRAEMWFIADYIRLFTK